MTKMGIPNNYVNSRVSVKVFGEVTDSHQDVNHQKFIYLYIHTSAILGIDDNVVTIIKDVSLARCEVID